MSSSCHEAMKLAVILAREKGEVDTLPVWMLNRCGAGRLALRLATALLTLAQYARLRRRHGPVLP
jgi:hypothetical protein